MYIAIEGIDTSGKSTQIDLLKSVFTHAIYTKEPGASSIGATIRDMILYGEVKSSMAEMFLFLADRAEHIEDVIKPNIERLIVSDRSLISGMAYAKNLDNQTLAIINKLAVENIMPDLVIILKLNEDELILRLSEKKEDKIEARGIEYLLEVQDRLLKSAKVLGVPYLSIDATKSKDDIFILIKEKITQMIKEDSSL